jgi:transcriptional regulator with XRE-family HTH domain
VDIARRLDLLFRTVTKKGGKEHSYREIEEQAGGVVSSTTIWKLRTGQTQNPSLKTLQALGTAFQVPVSFFFDEDVAPEDVSKYRHRYRSEQMVGQIALRSYDLDDEGKQAVLDMITWVRKAQGLEDNGEEEEPTEDAP